MMAGDKTKAVLEWLRDVLAWASKDPENRLEVALKEIRKHKEEVVRAVEEAIEPELRDYAKWFIALIFAGEVEQMEKATEGEEAGLPEGGHGEAEGVSEGGQGEGVGDVQSVAFERGGGDSVSMDVEKEVQGSNDEHSVLLPEDTGDNDEEVGESAEKD